MLMALEDRYKEATILDAQKRCRLFAEAFLSKLPKELRDKVFEHVWASDFDQVTQGRLHDGDLSYLPWLKTCKGKPCRCFHWWDISLWLQPRFVGLQVAEEAAVVYYRNMWLVMYPNEMVAFRSTLMSDRFHLGVLPADHVRYFHLDLVSSVSHRALPAFAEHLKALLKVSKKRKFELLLSYELGASAVTRLEVIRNVVEPLKEAGAHIQILSAIYGSHAEHDVSDYFGMSFEEWETKWKSIAKADLADDIDSNSDIDSDAEAAEIEAEAEWGFDAGNDPWKVDHFFSDYPDPDNADSTNGLMNADDRPHRPGVSRDFSPQAIEYLREVVADDATVSMIASRAKEDPKALEVVERVAYEPADYRELCDFRDQISKWRVQDGIDTEDDWGNNGWARALGFEKL